MNLRLLWILPAVLAAISVGILLALPPYVAARTHRPTIEALASTLTGETVHIAGPLSLSLLPEPQLTAQNITISTQTGETIQARTLTLQVALPALLHGRLRADSLSLDDPSVTLPSPMPNIAALTPPRWLARLHAQIRNGRLTAGGLTLTGINADILTGPSQPLAFSGSFTFNHQNFAASLHMNPVNATGTTPVTASVTAGPLTLTLNGGMNAVAEFGGTLTITAPGLTGSTILTATPDGITASALQLAQGAAGITGSVSLNFHPASAQANITGQNFDLASLSPLLTSLPGLPVTLTLNATNTTLLGEPIPALAVSADLNSAGATIHQLTATLPGNTLITATGTVSPAGALHGTAHLTSTSLNGLLGALPTGWSNASLTAHLGGTPLDLQLTGIAGTIGPSGLNGSLILSPGHAYGQLHFDELDFSPLLAWLPHLPPRDFYAGGEITADNATLDGVALSNVLLDGDFDKTLNIRRVSAALYGGLAAGSFSLDSAGTITAANGFLSLPSAEPLAAFIPPSWQPPAELLTPPLHLALTAQGPANAIAASLAAQLGDFYLTATPIIDLVHQTANGTVSLRNPSAINAMAIFGLNRGLAWPGAGSLSLRAFLTASPATYGLPDFSLSFGDLTATGSALYANNALSGSVTFDTLALPPLSTGLTLALSQASLPAGRVSLTANRVLYAGKLFSGPAAATLTSAPHALTLALAQDSIDAGTLTGTAQFLTAPGHPPQLTGTANLAGLDVSQLTLSEPFPFTWPAGTLAGAARLTASGFTPSAWAATLAGTANATLTNGTLTGFSLAGLTAALHSPARARALHTALTSGATPVTSLTLAATLKQGNATLTAASLASPNGTATATGSIDLPSTNVVLKLSLQPAVKPPLTITGVTLGPWSAPRQIFHLRPALAWKAPKSK